MLKDWILVTKQSLTQQPEWSTDLHHLTTLALTGLDSQSDSSDPINQLIKSSPNTYMIVATIFFKLLLWQTSTQPYLILKVLEGGGGWGSITPW